MALRHEGANWGRCALGSGEYGLVSVSQQTAENRLLALANAGYKSNLSSRVSSASDQKTICSADCLKRRQSAVPRFCVLGGGESIFERPGEAIRVREIYPIILADVADAPNIP